MGALAGRQAIVSGAAGGIGAAIVAGLIEQGATVHGLDRDEPGTARLARAHPGRFIGHSVDLADRRATDRAVAAVLERLAGRCDILINNAGIACLKPLAQSDDALLDEILAVNFTAAFRLTRALLPALRASGRATVINVASELALIGAPGYAAYCASKGALLAFSRALAVELASAGIRVNAVCPGPIDTAMLTGEFATSDDPAGARAAEIAAVPLARIGQPRDVAAVVAFLASDAAGFVCGAAWPVDGGKTAR